MAKKPTRRKRVLTTVTTTRKRQQLNGRRTRARRRRMNAAQGGVQMSIFDIAGVAVGALIGQVVDGAVAKAMGGPSKAESLTTVAARRGGALILGALAAAYAPQQFRSVAVGFGASGAVGLGQLALDKAGINVIPTLNGATVGKDEYKRIADAVRRAGEQRRLQGSQPPTLTGRTPQTLVGASVDFDGNLMQ